MKGSRILIMVMLAFFAVILSPQTQAQTSSGAEEWQLLGSHVVDYTLDYDVIPVTYKKGTFTTLRFKVSEGNINMHRCMVTFEDGEKQEIQIRHQFASGGEKIVDLKGNNRIIEKITFWYDTRSKSAQKAVIEVWGRK